mmetsp:Transcript_22440/g.34860  ORF Transcript_22440/g.34860 Transcript_22440/m.34860 type:complete len:428 (+) Transcript_22440:72-1355(+)
MGNAAHCHYVGEWDPCAVKDDVPTSQILQQAPAHSLATEEEEGIFEEFREETKAVEWHPGLNRPPCLLAAAPKPKKFEEQPTFASVPLDMPSEAIQPSLRLAEREKFEFERSVLISKVANNAKVSIDIDAKPESTPASIPMSPCPSSVKLTFTDDVGVLGHPVVAEPILRLQFQFEACDRTGVQLWTCSLANSSDRLVVTGVHSKSPFARTSSGGSGLVIGDIVLEVDGIAGNVSEMRQRFSKVAETGFLFEVVVQPRPLSFCVCLERTGAVWDKLGVVVGTDRTKKIPGCLRILFIKDDGLLAEWNKRHAPLKVCSGDWLTQVNGVSGNNKAGMQAALKPSDSQEIIWLTIATPARDERLPVRACAASKVTQTMAVSPTSFSRGRRVSEITIPPPESFPRPVLAEQLVSPKSRKGRPCRSMSVESH